MTVPVPPMSEVAHAIGEATIRYAGIEFVLHDLCVNLARFHDRQFEQEEAASVIDTVVSLMDLRQRVAAAKALAATGLDPDLYGQAETLLNYIATDLRNGRMRLIHDSWQERDGKIVRTQHGAHVARPQSRTIEVRRAAIMCIHRSTKFVIFPRTSAQPWNS